MKLWSKTLAPRTRSTSINNDARNTRNNGMHKSDIIFLHGTGSNARMWKHQMAFFTQLGHRCTVIDLRGHGQSHEPYEKTDLDVHVQDVLQTLQNTDLSFPAYFVGHSLGAIISLTIAERNPDLVKAVFAACAPPKLIKPVQHVFKFFINGPMQALKESDIKRILPWREQTLIEMPVFTMREIADYFSTCNLLSRVPKVNCPVHMACARFDPLAIHWHVKAMHKQLPNSTFKTFEWAGHNVMDYRIQDFNAWIRKYLD